MIPAVTDTHDRYQELFDVYWPIGVGVFSVIALLIVFVVLRFRSSSREFPQGKSHSKSEYAYAGLVTVVVSGLLLLTYNAMADLDDLPFEQDGEGRPGVEVAGAELVKVTAARWRWRFDYPRHGITQVGDTPTLVVPADTPVRFEQTSIDVVHSFWIPERRFKVDAFPGRTTTFTLTFPDEGFQRQGGQCNQYCGLRHSYMHFDIRVLAPEEFREWVRERRREPA